jgi:altronate dehydratase small subunit
MPLALAIHPADNVATLLEDAAAEPVSLLGESSLDSIAAREPITRGHKIALRALPLGTPVVKFGVTIGHTTSDVPAGSWVHTHNCASQLDPRSATLDRHSGAPTDTRYE